MDHDGLSRFKKFKAIAAAYLLEKPSEAVEEAHVPVILKFVHFWLLVGRSFVRNRCPVRASALAYSSLLAIIPMLAVVVSISAAVLKKEGEGPIRVFVQKIVDNVMPEAAGKADPNDARAVAARDNTIKAREQAVQKINEFIGNISSGTLGVTGMIVLVFVAISMLTRIEDTFNDIWGVTRGRSWHVRIVMYWAAITLGPLLLIVALGLASGPHLAKTKAVLSAMPFVGNLLFQSFVGNLLFQLLPVVVLCLMFGLLYQLMPSTRVQWQAALVGGLVAGVLWHINNTLSALFVSRVTSNNVIYGSAGMIPVFMVGLYFGWLILLFGAQVAYAYQNRQAYLQERRADNISQLGREFAALRLMTRIAESFQRDGRAPAGTELATTLGVPTKLAGQLLGTLVHAKLLAETSNQENGYLPTRPLDQITVHDILTAVRTGQGQELATREDAARTRVRSELERIQAAERQAAGVTLQELVREQA